MTKVINRYYLATFISELARTIPHPILVILLIDQKHLNLSEITFIQIFFYLGVLLFEIPSGYLADRGYRKSGYVASFVCMILAYGLIYISASIVILSLAWFIYGIGMALMSGNVDGYIVNTLKQNNLDEEIKNFNVKKTNISLIAGIAGALIGSLLYPYIYINVYVISLVMYVVAITIVVFGLHISHGPSNSERCKISDVKLTRSIKVLIVLLCLIEIYYVGFYQYWQVLYQAKGIEPELFGIIYIMFSFTVIMSNKLYSKLNRINDILAMFIFIASALFSILASSGILFCFTYPITLFIANMYVIDMYTSIYQNADQKSISSTISIVSSANRFFGIIILGMFAYLLTMIELSILLIISYLTFAISLLIIKNIKSSNNGEQC